MFTSSVQNWTPLTEFPKVSSGGDHVQNPITLGTTTMRQPETPDPEIRLGMDDDIRATNLI
jgi:hypothetical protein